MRKLLVGVLALLFTTSAVAEPIYRPSDVIVPVLESTNFSATELSFTLGVAIATGASTSRFIEAVRLMCSAACYVGMAATSHEASIVARVNAASGLVLAANVPEYFLASGGDYIIVIGLAGSGTLFIRTMTR